MKLFILFILQFCLFIPHLIGQTDCCMMIDRPEPGEIFIESLSLCFLENEDECFSMRLQSISEDFPGCPHNTLENPHWYVLFPSSETFELEISWSNCLMSRGIQTALYELDNKQKYSACHLLDYGSLIPINLFCDNAVSPIVIQQSNARDRVFYLLIDGTSGDACDFTIHANSGTFRGGLVDSLNLIGPSGMPDGYTATFTAQRFQHDCYQSYGCHCGVCNLDTFVVEWTGPPGAIVDPIPGTLQANITMGDMGGQVCIKIQDDCENLLRCVALELTDTEFYQKCPPEDVNVHDQSFPDPGVYFVEEDGFVYEIYIENYPEILIIENLRGCSDEVFRDCFFNDIVYPTSFEICSREINDTCFTYEYHIDWILPVTTTFNETICASDYFIFCGDTLRDEQMTDCIFTSSAGCDSIVVLTLTVVPPDTTFINENLCDPEVYIFQGDTFRTTGQYVVEVLDANACIDYFIIDLVVDEVDTTFILDSICGTDSYDFCGNTIQSEGVYYCTISTDASCDSIVELTLINPCKPDNIYSEICIGEEFSFHDSTLSEPGTYLLERPSSFGCVCIDTLILGQATLGSSSITSMGSISCENSSVDLSIDWDPLEYARVLGQTWYDELGLTLGSTDEISVDKIGVYSVVVTHRTLLNSFCMDTLYYQLEGDEEFSPELIWLSRDLFICDSMNKNYKLQFESDASHTTLTLNNSNQEWIDMNLIETMLEKNDSVYSFSLTLFNELMTCSRTINFEVRRQVLNLNWPDTLYLSDLAQLPNPMILANMSATNISYFPAHYLDNISDEILTFNSQAGGPFTLSFDIGSCHYEYTTFIQRDDMFIPTAFSPNDDGINDRFKAYTTSGIELTEMTIFNRWGGEVFSSNALPVEWDGVSKGTPAVSGIYLVQYSYKDESGIEKTGVGELMLLR